MESSSIQLEQGDSAGLSGPIICKASAGETLFHTDNMELPTSVVSVHNQHLKVSSVKRGLWSRPGANRNHDLLEMPVQFISNGGGSRAVVLICAGSGALGSRKSNPATP